MKAGGDSRLFLSQKRIIAEHQARFPSLGPGPPSCSDPAVALVVSRALLGHGLAQTTLRFQPAGPVSDQKQSSDLLWNGALPLPWVWSILWGTLGPG